MRLIVRNSLTGMAVASNVVNDPREGMELISGKDLHKLIVLGTYVAHLYENELRRNYEATLGSGSGFGGWSSESYDDVDKIQTANVLRKSLQELYDRYSNEELPKENEEAIKVLVKPVNKVLGWDIYDDLYSEDDDNDTHAQITSLTRHNIAFHSRQIMAATDPSPLKDTIVEEIVAKFQERSHVGIQKYGTTLDRDDLKVDDWINHIQEELMDAILYTQRLRRKLHEMRRKNGDDI